MTTGQRIPMTGQHGQPRLGVQVNCLGVTNEREEKKKK
jgi:hypothetical protein